MRSLATSCELVSTDGVQIPNWGSPNKTVYKFSGQALIFTSLVVLSARGEFTQRAVVTGANSSFSTPVTTVTDSVGGIHLSLVLGVSISGTRLLVNADEGAQAVNTKKPIDADRNLFGRDPVMCLNLKHNFA